MPVELWHTIVRDTKKACDSVAIRAEPQSGLEVGIAFLILCFLFNIELVTLVPQRPWPRLSIVWPLALPEGKSPHA